VIPSLVLGNPEQLVSAFEPLRDDLPVTACSRPDRRKPHSVDVILQISPVPIRDHPAGNAVSNRLMSGRTVKTGTRSVCDPSGGSNRSSNRHPHRSCGRSDHRSGIAGCVDAIVTEDMNAAERIPAGGETDDLKRTSTRSRV